MEERGADEVPKKKNRYDAANPVFQLFFCWIFPFCMQGYRRELTEEDLYRHRKAHDSGKLGDRIEAAWNRQLTTNKKNPSLIKAILRVFLPEVLVLFLIVTVNETARLVQPLLISQLLNIYDNNQIEERRDDAYFYAGMIVLSALLSVLTIHYYQLRIMQVGIKIRIALCSLIYRKALRLNQSALADTTVGQMVNLLSNDVGRFETGMNFLHQLWMAPLETFLVMYLCYVNVGYTGLVGTAFLLLSIPAQSWLGKRISQMRLNVAMRTDERVRLMNEIIAGIQVIKMYTWEKPFAKLVELVRGREIKYIRQTSVIRAILMSCGLVLNRAAVFLCIAVYVLTGNTLTSSYSFTMTSFYRLLGSVTMFLPQAISSIAEMLISIKRIRKFLLYDELDADTSWHLESTNSLGNGSLKPYATPGPVGVRLKQVSARWLKTSHENNLSDINVSVKSGDLVAVVGPVGTGKTTLFNLILGELKACEGSVQVQGTISYASQEPWLFGGTLRQNILFGQEFDQKKYDEVVRVCALERDFALFPYGDKTLAGERGVSLSGGQRARINLARAVYKEADIYLLDDPLSAVDAHVGKQLFEECISSYLAHKCVILVTHQLQYLKKIKRIYLLEEGRVLVTGTYDDLRKTDSKYSKLLANLEEEEEEIRRKSKMVEAEKVDNEGFEGPAPVLQKEAKVVGNITWRVYKNYMKAGGNLLKVVCLILAFLISQVLDSAAEYFVTFWVNINQGIKNNSTEILEKSRLSENSYNVSENSSTFQPIDEPSEIWYSFIFTSDMTIVYYSVLFVLIIIIVFSRSIAFYSWCITASSRLHNKMFDNIVFSPMLFFNNNPSGRILNRFSKDIGSLDEVLPMTLLDTAQIGLAVAAISVVIGSLSPYILVPTIVILVFFYFMRVFYLQTSRDVKRIDSITRSPIYTHLTASLQGLTTIRAFGAEEILKVEFDGYQNTNSAASFMFLGATRTFGFWLDFFCVVYVACVLAILLFLKSETFGGNIGLALTQTMGLMGMFQWGMRQWSELENQMTSVERVQEYADLQPEAEESVRKPPKYWPERGAVEFRDMSLRYAPEQPCVLKNLSFLVSAGEKVGIVGRTGAGKSSLIQALFRLASIEGSILIDDVDTKSVSFKTLRSKISIIPQEPVLFSGTLRKNLDPFDEYKDETLWDALEQVELKNAVNDLPSALESRMAEGGSNFSVGQRQLVCLARAIVRNNKVLVLDEATANVDPHTDVVIQQTIRNRFKTCTVLTIAHRLHTIMDSDKVLVMDAGRCVEFDHPHLLLQNENGVFHSLVMQTGRSTAKNLMAIAEEKFKTEQSI
uniref:Putative ABCC protein n=1 Tax=Chrysomela populi TaxID=154003 RepID=A0A0U9HVH0_CHRPP